MNLPRLMLLFICMISLYGIHAQTKTLMGGVYDVNGNPISKASVVVSHNDSVMGIAESNDDGKFSLDGLPGHEGGDICALVRLSSQSRQRGLVRREHLYGYIERRDR